MILSFQFRQKIKLFAMKSSFWMSWDKNATEVEFHRRLNSPSHHVLEQGPEQTCGQELIYGLTYGLAQSRALQLMCQYPTGFSVRSRRVFSAIQHRNGITWLSYFTL